MTQQNNWLKNTVLFMLSQVTSLFGSALVQYAIMWYITLETQSGIMMTISIICGFLPTFFLSPFAGVWADCFNRKLLIILSDGLIAFATLILAILFFMGYDAIWLLFVASSIRALGSGIQQPAVGAIIPQIVPQEKLMKVNGLNGSVQSIITLISPIISAALLTVASIELIFLIDVITAIIAILILTFLLKIPKIERKSTEAIDYFGDLKKGYQYIKNHSFLKNFLVFNAFFLILIAPLSFLTPLQVTRSFGDDVWRLTTIEVAFSVGMIFGGLIVSVWSGFKNKLHTMIFANIIISIATVLLGIIPYFIIYSGLMALIGLVLPMFNAPLMVLIQQKVEGEYLGRVFGVISMVSSIMMPLGMLVFGPVADYIDIEWLLIGSGLLLIILCLLMLRNKALIEAGKPVEPEAFKEI